MKFKMAATAGLSLTLDPMGKMFPNTSSLKPLGQLKPNCPEIIIWRSSKKKNSMPIRNPRWLPPQVIVLTQDHMGKYRNIFFSEAIAPIEPKLHQSLEGPLQTSCFLCWSEFQDDYYQVNDTGSWEPLVLFLLAIVFSVLLWYMDSDYPFGIFKLFLLIGNSS